MKNILNKLESMIQKEKLRLVKTDSGESVLVFEGSTEYYPIETSQKRIRKLFYNNCGILLNSKQIQTIIEYLEIHSVTDDTIYETTCRIFNGTDIWAYELDKDTGECVVITPSEIGLGTIPNVFFKHSADYQNQVVPDDNVDIRSIFMYISCHFNLKDEKQEKLLILYLVTAFWGNQINHPLLVLTGEKGSSKSTTMRKLEKLIDPKSSDLCGIPKGSDGLELRLANTYFVALDNLSGLNRNISDLLARAVTGGTVTKRALYHDTKEIVLDIKSLVAINGVSLVARESDLLDRSLILELNRISARYIKSEQELWSAFERDRPKILGCIFLILRQALFDNEPVKIKEKIRLADFHVACVKVGRVLGMSEDEVSQLLWENQSRVNRHSIDEDIVACCVIELMKTRRSYVNSMTGLLGDLNKIAIHNNIVGSTLPKTPNHLSNRLSKVKSNLSSEYDISYSISNVGAFKEITIRNNGKICESCESQKKKKRRYGELSFANVAKK